MPTTTNLDVLRNLGSIAEELKNTPTSSDYWEKEDKWLSKQIEKEQKFNKSISMSKKKYHQSFSL